MSRKGSEKYESILRAAIRVFADVGYHNAQVARIAKEAGVADGTIYLYFSNKADILISVFRESMGVYVESLRLHLAEESGAKAKLRRLVYEHFKSLATDIELAIVTQIELRQADRAIREGIEPFLKAYLDLIDELVEEGKKEGVFRYDMETHIARKMIFGTLDETVTSWVMGHKKRPLLNLAEPVFNALFHGMRICHDEES
ncbi:MAG: TetR/AcrR family transcriptional regulator [Candidatus Carbobacillus sp.]|nr:TetR/AcrR family transcriptional regulator [Candidatus Carbobacillus sp.]